MKIYAYFIALLCIKSSVTTESLIESSTVGEIDATLGPINTVENVVEKSVNDFGFRLLKTMLKHNGDQNIVMSPTSITGLLAMTLLGSAGTTYDEIAQLIGFTQDISTNRLYHEMFGSKLQALNANDTKTLYANAAFVDVSARLRDVYREYLGRVYRSDAQPVDFADGLPAKKLINEWVKGHTGNKIEEFLQQPLPASTKAVLLSALYFSGQWAFPFVPFYTNKWPFQTPTKEVQVDLMANFGQFNFVNSYEDGIKMIAFPYNDSVTTMYVIIPRLPKSQNISTMIDNLNYEKIDQMIEKMSMKKCVIRFPKMELKSKVDLKEPLVALGAGTMFSPGKANFALMLDSNKINNSSEDKLLSRIANGEGETKTFKDLLDSLANPGLHIDSILHEVKMTVDEYGTEAVAATSAVMARSAELFYVDSPFYMFIRNERTKLVTFSAVVLDPSSSL